MAFETDIEQFERFGTYTYSFDKYGNIILNASASVFSQKYLSLPINNFLYNNKKIESFYETEFTEFLPQLDMSASVNLETQVQEQNESLSKLEQENAQLRDQLKSVIAEAEVDGTQAEQEAIRQVIVDLRISLKEGNTEEDFLNEFPYQAKDGVEVQE